MENKLEQLLNSLIEKGWRIENPKARIWDVKYMYWLRELRIVYETDRRDAVRQYPIRFLVSKESNLWQFVCENGMVKKEWNSEWTIIYPNERTGDYQKCHSYCKWQSEYWILESSLKDESELEQFLLSNIVIKDEE